MKKPPPLLFGICDDFPGAMTFAKKDSKASFADVIELDADKRKPFSQTKIDEKKCADRDSNPGLGVGNA